MKIDSILFVLGNTETVAGYISETAGLSMKDIGDASEEEISSFDSLIVGAPSGTQELALNDHQLLGMTFSTTISRV